VVEQFDESRTGEELAAPVEFVARHAAAALSNGLSVDRLPMIGLARALDRLRWLTQLRRLPIWASLAAAMAVVVAVLVLVPIRFHVEAVGQLQPVARHVIFAPDDAVVVDLPLENRPDDVATGDPLVVLHSSDLEYELETVRGQKQTVDQQLRAIAARRTQASGRSSSDSTTTRLDDLTAGKRELEAQRRALEKRLDILRRQQKTLTLTSPIDGRVQTWNVIARLRGRPVRQGDRLLTVVDLAGPWRVDLDVPEGQIGYLLEAQGQLDGPLEVEMVLKSDPAAEFRGQVEQIALAAEPDPSGGLVPLRVTLAPGQPLEPRPGATVYARIHCGQRSIAFVWLHDLFEAIRLKLMF